MRRFAVSLAWRLRILGLGIALAAGMIPIAALAGSDFIGGTCSALISPACARRDR